MSLTITVGGTGIAFDESTFKLQPKLDDIWRLQVTLLDYTATTFFQYGEKVVVTDPTLGVLYTGFLVDDTQDKSNTYPDTTIEHQVDCIDGRYLADKRTSNRLYTAPTSAGKIVVDMLHDVLTAEGVISHYALQYIQTQANWAQGTLATTIATANIAPGDLELTGSGGSVSETYDSSTQWNTGTISNVSVNGPDISLVHFTRQWYQQFGQNATGPFSGETLFGNGSPSEAVSSGLYQQNAGATGAEMSARMDFAGTWSSGTMSVTTYALTAPGTNQIYGGLTYLTTTWNNNPNTYAYAVEVTKNQLQLIRGSNGGSGSRTVLATATVSWPDNPAAPHTLSVTFGGGTHKVYVDGTQYISVSDSTYTTAGYVACRSGGTGTASGGDYFANFDIFLSTPGIWTSPSISVNSVSTVASSAITFDTSLSTYTYIGGTVLVQSSIDGGSTYQTCTSGGNMPGLTPGASGTGKSVIIKVTLATTLPGIYEGNYGWPVGEPDIQNLVWSVQGGYNTPGTRSTAPLGNDTMVRANVGSGFGTSFDSQTYTQYGTGTTNLTSDEAQIVNTTGDVYMQLGSTTYTDEEATVHFTLSASTMTGGCTLRFTDTNNNYRCIASTTALTISKKVAGSLFTIGTTAVTIPTSTFYWMRFQLIGSNPITVQGRVWAAGTLEPTSWNLNLLD